MHDLGAKLAAWSVTAGPMAKSGPESIRRGKLSEILEASPSPSRNRAAEPRASRSTTTRTLTPSVMGPRYAMLLLRRGELLTSHGPVLTGKATVIIMGGNSNWRGPVWCFTQANQAIVHCYSPNSCQVSDQLPPYRVPAEALAPAGPNAAWYASR